MSRVEFFLIAMVPEPVHLRFSLADRVDLNTVSLVEESVSVTTDLPGSKPCRSISSFKLQATMEQLELVACIVACSLQKQHAACV